jgi:tetratricopeptide (TPR) repeat protein
MKEHTTPDEALALHKILCTDPQRYLQIVNEWIEENPQNTHAYFNRHQAWMRIGEPRRALEDLNKAIAVDRRPTLLEARGSVYRHLGEYVKALDDYRSAEAMDPAKREEDAFGLLFQADVHARLGDESAALACCARLPENFWTPGLHDAPAGDKVAVAERLKLIAADAKRARLTASATPQAHRARIVWNAVLRPTGIY